MHKHTDLMTPCGQNFKFQKHKKTPELKLHTFLH